MLKAELLKRGKSIYYNNSNSRTITLDNCIKLIYTNEKGSLRKNLETIIELRNISTHFITEEYERIYAPLFQANVINYIDQIRNFHSVEITDYISQNFLTLSIRLDDLEESKLRGKYSPEMLKKLLQEKNKVNHLMKNENKSFAIPIETKFYLIKDKNDADLLIGISKDSEEKAQIINVMKDPNNLYPYTQKDIISLVNKKLRLSNILLTSITNNGVQKRPFNKNDFQLFITFYNIKSDDRYCYHFKIGNRFTYSNALVDFLTREIEGRPETILTELKKGLKK